MFLLREMQKLGTSTTVHNCYSAVREFSSLQAYQNRFTPKVIPMDSRYLKDPYHRNLQLLPAVDLQYHICRHRLLQCLLLKDFKNEKANQETRRSIGMAAIHTFYFFHVVVIITIVQATCFSHRQQPPSPKDPSFTLPNRASSSHTSHATGPPSSTRSPSPSPPPDPPPAAHS